MRPDEDHHEVHNEVHNVDDNDGESNKSTINVKMAPDVPMPSKEAFEAVKSTTSTNTMDTQLHHLHPKNSTSKVHSASVSVPSQATPPSPSTVRRAESHRVPYFRYFGPTAIVPGFKQMVVSVRDRRRSTGGSLPGTSPLSTHSGPPGSSSAVESDAAVEDLPVYDPNDPAPVHSLIIHLVNTFFLQMGSNYPFLKKTRFLQMVKEKRVEPILVDSVCALAARFSDSQALTGGSEKMPRTERGAVFAQRARQATVDTFPCPTVGAVQACLLMAYEGFGANQDSALWMYLGLAIRMAVDLGIQKEVGVQYQGEKDPWYIRNLNRKSENPEEKSDDANGVSPEEQNEVVQERRDTFWAVFILDRVISSGTGRPVTFRDDDFELSFPMPSIDPVTNWPRPFPIFLNIIHLYGRMCDVLNNIRDMQDLTKEKWDKLNEIEHQLTRLYKSWDSRLQFNVSNFKAYLSFGQGTTFILLHFWFHALFIILHQPTLLTPFGELRSELQLLADSRELSMSSAKTICDILSFADLIDPKSFIGNPFTSQPIYIAACAFLMESSANASETPSRANSPPGAGIDAAKPSNRHREKSRHSLLASAANQNYQRCYNSLQQIGLYWGGVKYILTALDQKAKGIWDVETYTMEEYESTKTGRREGKGNINSRFPRFDQATPKVAGPPIAWALAGTANSPNSSLTLMYQNLDSNLQNPQAQQQVPRQPSTPPGNMVYDPIRQSLPESGTIFLPGYSQPSTSAFRQASRQAMPRRVSNLTSPSSLGRQAVKFNTVPEDPQETDVYMGPGYSSSTQQTNGFESFNASPPTAMADAPNAFPNSGSTNGMYFSPGMTYQNMWGASNMDSITFDSQDIDIGALGLEQEALMAPWLNYNAEELMGLFENQDMNQEGQQ